jgi:hypothetical protein
MTLADAHVTIMKFRVHAMTVMAAPALMPANPKHATVEKVGNASFVFAITSGELPVF